MESRAVRQLCRASPKIHEWGAMCEQVHCHGATSRSCFSTLHASSFPLLPQTIHNLQVKLSIDCLTTWNKLMIKDALPIKKKRHNHIWWTLTWFCIFFGPQRRFSHPFHLSKSFYQFQTDFHATHCSSTSFAFQIAKIAKGTGDRSTLPWWLIDVALSGKCEAEAYVHCYIAPLLQVACVG
jgi:hypothetical protein